MKKNNEFLLYTCMWIAAVIVLMALLMQSLGDARIINYSGIVRGATQKLVKEEMNGEQDDALIERLDGIIDNLRTGQGNFAIQRNKDREYQERLDKLDSIWGKIKTEIQLVRTGQADFDALYALSQEHFTEADKMVLRAEQSSENKLIRFILTYGAALVLSVCIFTLLNKRNQKALENSIYTDNLTGILNRAGFKAGAASVLRQFSDNRYCLMEFDIDDFKFLNNSYGFELGDKLLCALADRLQKSYHTEEMCARIAADDFVILAKQRPHNVSDLRRILSEVFQQEELRNVSEFITFTVGGYGLTEKSEPVQSALDKANMAHKNAKTLGKATTTWYNEKFLEKLNRENKLKNRLKKSIENGEFKMYLQPKYELSALEVKSAEALVRWDIEGYGIMPPDEFIPLFESNGQIAEIDFYMLEKACAYIRRYMEEHGSEFYISVNFSRVTIYQQRFYATVLEIIKRYQIPYHCIEIEITESAFNGISDVMLKKILQMQELGFVISMDDFGSGYSSLNLLDRLPIEVLKLDREFLREYDGSPRVKNVIGGIVELAHALEIRVVCEGVETREHVEFLRGIGCDSGQGFYFSRPIPEEEFRLKYETGRD